MPKSLPSYAKQALMAAASRRAKERSGQFAQRIVQRFRGSSRLTEKIVQFFRRIGLFSRRSSQFLRMTNALRGGPERFRL